MNHENAVEPKLLSSQIKGSVCVDSSEIGLKEFKNRLGTDTLGVITGSLYFIGEVRGQLVKSPFVTVAQL